MVNYNPKFNCVWLFFSCAFLWGEEFSKPRDFSNFESDLGEQKLVEIIRPWVGPTLNELAPGAIPLGSMRNKTYLPAEKFSQNPQPLVSVKIEESIELPKNQNFPLEFTGEAVPVDNSAPGWVGPLLSELAPRAIPLGSLANRKVVQRTNISDARKSEEVISGDEQKENFLRLNTFFSTRPYYTYNVLRIRDGEDEAGVWENLLGASFSTRPLTAGRYLTLIPKLDLMMQVASYEDKEVGGANLQDLLGYRFGLIKAGIDFEFPRDYSFKMGYEYDLLNSLDTGDKMFDAWVPSLGVGKIFSLGESTLLMLDANARYSMTDRQIANPLPGQFPDDGDNLQVGVSLMLIKLLGPDGQFMLMPSLSFSRSEYLNHDNDGRVDWTTTLSLNGSWQATKWLSLDIGLTCSILRMNDVGQLLQGPSSRYEALDLGGSIMASHAF